MKTECSVRAKHSEDAPRARWSHFSFFFFPSVWQWGHAEHSHISTDSVLIGSLIIDPWKVRAIEGQPSRKHREERGGLVCETQAAMYLTVKPTVRRLCGLLLPWDSRLLVRKGWGNASEWAWSSLMTCGSMETALQENHLCVTTLLYSRKKRKYKGWKQWRGHHLTCIKWCDPILRLHMWEQDPIAKLRTTLSYHIWKASSIKCAKCHTNDKSGIQA